MTGTVNDEVPDPQARNCYCGLWNTHPEHFAGKDLPRGYCGHCQSCGRPGHTRHFPGASPYTGSWCDRHYRQLMFVHPLGVYGQFFWIVLVGLLAAAYFLLRRT